MLILGAALSLIGLAALAAAAWLWLAERKSQARRRQMEQEAAAAALEYLTKFGVRCATAAIAVTARKLAILIETEPQKKLRFSYIIEQPLRDYVNKATGLNVRWVYWRFPVPRQERRVPEVKYPAADTIAMIDNRDVLPPPSESLPGQPAPEAEIDEYFHEQAYQIEEIDWEQFNTQSDQAPPAAPVSSDIPER